LNRAGASYESVALCSADIAPDWAALAPAPPARTACSKSGSGQRACSRALLARARRTAPTCALRHLPAACSAHCQPCRGALQVARRRETPAASPPASLPFFGPRLGLMHWFTEIAATRIPTPICPCCTPRAGVRPGP